MTYPPQLPTVLFSVLNPVEGRHGRSPRRAAVMQSSGHGLRHAETTELPRVRHYPRRRIQINRVGVRSLVVAIALAVVVALGAILGDAEEGATGSRGLQPGSGPALHPWR